MAKEKLCKICLDPFRELGVLVCENCDTGERSRFKRKMARTFREEAYKAAGLVKARGALGGTYWE